MCHIYCLWKQGSKTRHKSIKLQPCARVQRTCVNQCRGRNTEIVDINWVNLVCHLNNDKNSYDWGRRFAQLQLRRRNISKQLSVSSICSYELWRSIISLPGRRSCRFSSARRPGDTITNLLLPHDGFISQYTKPSFFYKLVYFFRCKPQFSLEYSYSC